MLQFMLKPSTFKTLLISLGLLAGTALLQVTDAAPLSAEQARLAAEKDLQLAQQTDPPDKQAQQLSAAQSLIQANLITEGNAVLQHIDEVALSPDLAPLKHLLSAQVAVTLGKRAQALQQLRQIQSEIPTLSTDMQQRYYALLARVFMQSGDVVKSIKAHLALSGLLSDETKQLENNKKIAHLLQITPSSTLNALAMDDTNPMLRDWAALALLTRMDTDFNTWLNALSHWQSAQTDPMLSRLIPQAASSITPEDLPFPEQPQQVALLLPLSGRLASSGEAIEKGFLTAYYNALDTSSSQNRLKQVKIYDTANGQPIETLYQQALDDGADIVVGPLLKANLNTLIRQHALRVPTIGLNNTDNTTSNTFFAFSSPTQHLYQFALSADDETQQVANKAWRDGKHRAFVFVPDTLWGAKVATVFEKTWRSYGADVVQTINYDDKTDLDSTVKTAFNVDQSNKRANQLMRVLGIKVKTTPRRREDVDMIFMATNPTTARQLMPLFKFYYADNVPVYATSSIYGGSFDQANRDLNGVLFCDMPFLLSQQGSYLSYRQQLHQLWPNETGSAQRLYALGLDAYALIKQINQMTVLPLFMMPDQTGWLSIQKPQRVYRQLDWAQMNNAKAQLITTT